MAVQWQVRENQYSGTAKRKYAAYRAIMPGTLAEPAPHAQGNDQACAICIGPGSLPKQAAGRQHDLEGVAEQAAVNLTLTVFQIDPVERTVEIVHFTFFDGRYAQGAGDFLQLLKHGKPLSFTSRR